MTPFEIHFEATPKLTASLYRAFLWKTQAGYMIASVFLAGLGLWGIATGSEPVFCAFWLGVAVTFWYGWWMGTRRARAAVVSRAPLALSFAADEKGCTFRGTDSSLWFAWREVSRVDVTKAALLLSRRNASSSVPIPAAALSAEQRSEILSAARAVGARVR